MSFVVTKVIDGGTFEVTPDWKCDNETGNLVKPAGCGILQAGQQSSKEAKERLANLLNSKVVDLKNGLELAYGGLVCDVELNGRNLADYFPKSK